MELGSRKMELRRGGEDLGMVAGVVGIYWWCWNGERRRGSPEFRRSTAAAMAAMGAQRAPGARASGQGGSWE